MACIETCRMSTHVQQVGIIRQMIMYIENYLRLGLLIDIDKLYMRHVCINFITMKNTILILNQKPFSHLHFRNPVKSQL